MMTQDTTRSGRPYMTPAEVEASARIGNHIAAQITATGKRNVRFMANAAIRHYRSENGTEASIQFAGQLLGISEPDARRLVDWLARSKPDDIVSPHYE